MIWTIGAKMKSSSFAEFWVRISISTLPTLIIFLESDSGKKLKEIEDEYQKLQLEIIELDTTLADLNSKIAKLQTAPTNTTSTSLGRDFFYNQPKTPDEILRELIAHLQDFHRCQ